MSKVFIGMLIAFLLVACSVGSALDTEETTVIRLLPEDTSSKIGDTIFSFHAPFYDKLNLRTAEGNISNSSYTSVTMLYYNYSNLMIGYVEVTYYPNGRPSNDIKERILLDSFREKVKGDILGVNETYSRVGKYPAKVWNIYNPANEKPGALALVYIDSNRTVNMVGSWDAFDVFQPALKVGLKEETSAAID
jgi:hypothetical protein